MLGDSKWHVYLPHLQCHVLMKVLLCGPFMCCNPVFEAPSLWRLVDPRIILFWWYLFSRKVSFFSSSSHMEGFNKKRHSNWPWKEGGGNQARGWNVANVANISSPLRFSRGWKMNFFFFWGQVRPILRGEMAVSFSFTFCRWEVKILTCLLWNIIYRSICIQPDVHIQYTVYIYSYTLLFWNCIVWHSMNPIRIEI